MVQHNSSGSDSWRAWAWRGVAVVQGIAVFGIVAAGGLWAMSLDRTAVQSPEALEPRAVASTGAAAGGHVSWTVYIAGSEEEALALRSGIDEGNNIRDALGLDPLREEVVVAANLEAARGVERALLEGNLILASFKVEDRVVNLVV